MRKAEPVPSKADWSRKLAKPIDIGRRKLKTLDDVRSHILALPEARQGNPVWHNVAGALLKAAEGGDLRHVTVALWFARQLDR